MEPDGVGRDGGREPCAVASLADAVHRSQRGTDEREIRAVRGERGCQRCIDGWGAHPDFELRRASRGGVEVDGRAGFPWNQVERDLMVGAEDGRHVVDGLVLRAVLGRVHADRRGRYDAATLPGRDGGGAERSAVVVPDGLVSDGLVGQAFAGEHRMLGLDGFVRTDRRRDLDELSEELAAEHAVVFEPLIAALELGGDAFSGAPRRHRTKIKACEQIGPEIGHSLSVSPILR
jgi:hypothetical protein